MLNQVVLIGRLTKEPEVFITSDQKAVLNLTLAINRFRKTKQIEQTADFIPCVLWGRRAIETEKCCRKGSLIAVNGAIQTRSFINKEEKKVYVVEVVAHKVRFLCPARRAHDGEQSKIQ